MILILFKLEQKRRIKMYPRISNPITDRTKTIIIITIRRINLIKTQITISQNKLEVITTTIITITPIIIIIIIVATTIVIIIVVATTIVIIVIIASKRKKK